MNSVEISIIIPVYNEERNLSELFRRLIDTLDPLGRSYEIIFTNDGSRDRSIDLLKEFHRKQPYHVTVIDFNGNYGQHMAIIAGFERAKGEVAITLDADLQNPPEEIPKLLAKFDEGYDVVGGYRAKRKDTFARRYCSKLINKVRERTTSIQMTDQGCMLRAYAQHVYDAIVRSGERSLFIPALAHTFAANPAEIEVQHSERANGASNYSYYKLIRLNFDLITGFTLMPLQLFTTFGFIVSGLSGLLVVYMALRRLIIGPEAEGLFTLFAILLFLVSVAITGIGLVGEYVGRAYQTVQNRPRYLAKNILPAKERKPRIAFFGYSEVGFQALQTLIDRNTNIVAVFTHEDDPGENHWFRSVEELARSNNLPVFKPDSIKDPKWTSRVREMSPDLILSFYYRKLIPTSILNLARLGAYNMHGSYLPKYRGKAPVNWAVLNGETKTGATLHVMAKEPDAGDIIDQEGVSIEDHDTAFDVMKKVQEAAVIVLQRQLDNLLSGTTNPIPQEHDQATYYGGRRPEDGCIDWNQPAKAIHNLVRAVSHPYPGAFADYDGMRLKVWKTRCSKTPSAMPPGTITALAPLTVATLSGQIEILDCEWVSLDPSLPKHQAPRLEIGDDLSLSTNKTY